LAADGQKRPVTEKPIVRARVRPILQRTRRLLRPMRRSCSTAVIASRSEQRPSAGATASAGREFAVSFPGEVFVSLLTSSVQAGYVFAKSQFEQPRTVTSSLCVRRRGIGRAHNLE
jgi:hypothetical protein